MQYAKDRQLNPNAYGLNTSGLNPGGHSARDYGRSAEPLPDLHVFSALSELDEAYAEELARARARQETLEREVAELAKRLAAPLDPSAPMSLKTGKA